MTHGSKSDAERTASALPFHPHAPILDPRQLHNTKTIIAVQQLLERFPNLERDRSQPLELRPAAFVYSLKHYPVRLG